MACAQTGSGKTASFLLPVIASLMRVGNESNSSKHICYPECVIIVPTRELCEQVYNEARKFAFNTTLRVAGIYGGIAVKFQHQIISEHYSPLAKNHRQTLMFSATFPPDVQAIASRLLKADFVSITVDRVGVANRCISQHFIECRSLAEKKNNLLELLDVDLQTFKVKKDSDIFKRKTLVFVNQKQFVVSLGVLLCEVGLPTTTMHSNQNQHQRTLALEEFKNGAKPVLIATDVCQRGLDIKGVDHVINYDLPYTGEEYIIRIGRTGRAGNAGKATSLYCSENNRGLAWSLVKILADVGQDAPAFLINDMEKAGIRFDNGSFVVVDDTECWSC
ncbi:helicase protein [Dictyocaulus viviparus]|uniref:RNA helicase n=1 Tax=Dictyocaulus viviparus TaxID=29172 RepID=A0A0D8XJB5_DICVI|nr:helicase protein [Dictyocaulus viviparus]